MATCEGPGSVVEKNRMSPGARSSVFTDFPTRYCSRTSRGSDRPCRENTYCVNPLQSKPDGSAPPLMYGVPRSDNAVPASAYPSIPEAGPGGEPPGGFRTPSDVVRPAGLSGVAGTAGASLGGCETRVPPGVGNGRGVAPVDAHPPAQAAVRANVAIAMPVRRGASTSTV